MQRVWKIGLSGRRAFQWLFPLAVAGLLSNVVFGAGQEKRTVLDGVYSAAQAERGKTVYLSDCASCHGDSLQGADEAPGLSGPSFVAPWVDVTVGELFDRLRISMPQDRPGKLSRQAYADLVAYILQVNEYPAGQTELDASDPRTQQVVIVAKPTK